MEQLSLLHMYNQFIDFVFTDGDEPFMHVLGLQYQVSPCVIT